MQLAYVVVDLLWLLMVFLLLRRPFLLGLLLLSIPLLLLLASPIPSAASVHLPLASFCRWLPSSARVVLPWAFLCHWRPSAAGIHLPLASFYRWRPYFASVPVFAVILAFFCCCKFLASGCVSFVSDLTEAPSGLII